MSSCAALTLTQNNEWVNIRKIHIFEALLHTICISFMIWNGLKTRQILMGKGYTTAINFHMNRQLFVQIPVLSSKPD